MAKASTTWVLVADGAKARVFSFDQGKRELDLVHEMGSEEARQKPSEILSDNEGRRFDTGPNQRSTVGAATDPQRYAKEVFSRDVASYLDKAATQHSYERLVLVAAPQMLGDLRSELSKPAASKVDGELAKDLTNLDQRELIAHLEEVL
jgi:protein required for attachment to host cells